MTPNPLTSWLLAQLEAVTPRARTMPDPFTCPFCSGVKHNPSDADRRYCRECRVFVDDAIARRDALGACRGHATTLGCTTERLEQCEACGLEVSFDQVHHRFFGFGAGCIWREAAITGLHRPMAVCPDTARPNWFSVAA